jgi:hypothetical protein
VDQSTAAQQTGVVGGSGISVGYRQDLAIEMTQSNFTTDERQLIWSDGIVSARYTLHHSDIAHIGIIGSAQLPFSLASRGADRVVAPGASLNAAHTFDVLQGMQVAGVIGYKHWFATSNNAVLGERDPVRGVSTIQYAGDPVGYGCEAAVVPDDPTVSRTRQCNPGATTGRDYLNATVALVVVPLPRVSLSTSFTWLWTRADSLRSFDVRDTGAIVGPGADTARGDTKTHWRNATYFSLSVGYDIASYLSLTASYATYALNINENGAFLENPIWNEKSTVSLTANFRFDAFYGQYLQSHSSSAATEGGVTTARAPVTQMAW